MNNTPIEWADHTINYHRGCQKVSEGCKNCYAERLDARFKGGHWGPGSSRKLQISTARKQLAKAQAGQRVFVNSMGDTFEAHPDLAESRAALFADIAARPDVVFMLLTKRPENVANMVPIEWLKHGFPPNVWMGVSVEHQAAADLRIPALLQLPAAVRFLSCEPLLGPVDLYHVVERPAKAARVPHTPLWPQYGRPVVHWVIVGGESGTHARSMHPTWARTLRDQCAAAQVPFFFKQWGEFGPVPQHHLDLPQYRTKGMVRDDLGPIVDDTGLALVRLGKKAAGRLLDGVEHNALPHIIS
jgi:protein gp37